MATLTKTTPAKRIKPLRAENICKGDYTRGRRHCAAGWLSIVAVGNAASHTPVHRRFERFIANNCIMNWNDNLVTRADAAAKLNAFFRAKGWLLPTKRRAAR